VPEVQVERLPVVAMASTETILFLTLLRLRAAEAVVMLGMQDRLVVQEAVEVLGVLRGVGLQDKAMLVVAHQVAHMAAAVAAEQPQLAAAQI
jgi:hypothetical protein